MYLDIEDYSTTNPSCVAAVKAFTRGWTSTLNSKGRVPGIYGTTGSMVADLVYWRGVDPSYPQPSEVWFAHTGQPANTDDASIPPDAWSGHRVHQFTQNVTETYSGVSLTIDADVTSASVFTAVGPSRLYDSVTATIGTGAIAVKVAGHAGVPTNATAVALTIQIAGPTANAQLVVAPYQSSSGIGLQQFTKGQSISQTVIVGLHQGNIQLRVSAGQARILVNVDGYYSAATGSRFTADGPSRLYDSVTATIGTGAIAVKVAGHAGVPTNATAVALTIQIAGPTANAQLVVAPYQSSSGIGLQQFTKGQSISQTVIVGLHQGNIQLRVSAGQARILVNVDGYYSAATGSRFTAVGPSRLYDSVTATIGTGAIAVKVAGHAGVPTNATAVALTIQIAGPTANAQLVVAPYQSSSGIGLQQFTKGQSISQTVIVGLHQGNIQLRVSAGQDPHPGQRRRLLPPG